MLGPTVVTDLFGEGVDPVGQKIKFGGSTWTVIGMLKAKGSNGFQDQDDIAIAPVTSVQDSLSSRTRGYNQITVQAKSRGASDAASAEITSTLLSTHKVTTADFQVLNQAALLDASAASNSVFTVLARCGRRDLAARRRHRRDEHHAGDRHRADARDRHPQGDRREEAPHPQPVPRRVRAACRCSAG